MTVSELAKASSASEASVSRFCRRIGMKGFHQLKISLAKEMKNARSIVFTAAGNTIPVAMDGAFKFTQLGKRAYASPIWEMQIGSIGTLGPEDVVIAISNSGESRSVV